MISWWAGLSVRGKLILWGAIGLAGNLITLPFGIFFPKLLVASLAMLLVGMVMKVLGSSEKNETMDLSKLKESNTATLQFKIQNHQAGPLLHAVAGIFDQGNFRENADALAQSIQATKLYESGKKQFKVSYSGKPGSLLICWTKDDGNKLSLTFEIPKESLPAFQSLKSTFSG